MASSTSTSSAPLSTSLGNKASSGVPVGAIAGGTIGGAAVAIGVLATTILLLRRRKTKSAHREDPMLTQPALRSGPDIQPDQGTKYNDQSEMSVLEPVELDSIPRPQTHELQ
jgi:hypothetical protein